MPQEPAEYMRPCRRETCSKTSFQRSANLHTQARRKHTDSKERCKHHRPINTYPKTLRPSLIGTVSLQSLWKPEAIKPIEICANLSARTSKEREPTLASLSWDTVWPQLVLCCVSEPDSDKLLVVRLRTKNLVWLCPSCESVSARTENRATSDDV